MFACLWQPSSQPGLFGLPPAQVIRGPGDDVSPGAARDVSALEVLAREFSPRVEVHHADLVSLDIAGLGRLLGTPADIAQELQRSAGERGMRLRIAVAPTRTAAMLLAIGRPGVSVVLPGREREAVAPIALGILRQLPADVARFFRPASGGRATFQASGPRPQASGLGPQPLDASEVVSLLQRWGLKTLGDLAALPSRPLSERLGQHGVMWQRLARGEDLQPLLPREADAPIEETVDLEWPVEGLEPLSFVFARLCESLADRLAVLDLAAVVLHLSFRLVSRDTATRELQLPAPMRDPKVLRTLILLHLESHPLQAGVDRLSLRVDVAPARVTQFSLLARARPFPEQMATLIARLSALLGERRVGAPALVDTHRPGAFTMAPFSGGAGQGGAGFQPVAPGAPCAALRRFRVPVPARVILQDGRPVRVSMERRGLEGGAVTAATGPWRTSGEWWRVEPSRPDGSVGRDKSWNRDEWDVALSDGALYRIYRDRAADRWFVDGIVD